MIRGIVITRFLTYFNSGQKTCQDVGQVYTVVFTSMQTSKVFTFANLYMSKHLILLSKRKISKNFMTIEF